MKFFVLLGALAMQCAMVKSWHVDSYMGETVWPHGWISYLRRVILIGAILSGFVLYYIPGSRPHARRMCFAIIDLIASSLKLILGGTDRDLPCRETRSVCDLSREEPVWVIEKQLSEEISAAFQNVKESRRSRSKSIKANGNNDGSLSKGEKRRMNSGQNKLERKTYHHHRTGISKDTQPKIRAEIIRPATLNSNRLSDVQKYLVSRLNRIHGLRDANLGEYALIISANPQEVAMLDRKYTKSEVLILQETYPKLECKDSSTLTDNSTAKPLVFVQEPIASHNDPVALNSETDKYLPTEYESETIADGKESNNSEYEINQYQCSGYDAGLNYSPSSTTFNYARVIADLPSTAAKSSELQSRLENSSKTENISLKFHNFTHGGESQLLKRGQNTEAEMNRDASISHHRTIIKRAAKKNIAEENDNCCSVSFATESDAENCEFKERVIATHEMNNKFRSGKHLSAKNSEEILLNYELEDLTDPGEKPTLLRIVSWIFGTCPEALRQAAADRADVGKEETKGVADSWLHWLR